MAQEQWTPEQLKKQTARAESDANLIKQEAEYVQVPGDKEPRLDVPAEAIQAEKIYDEIEQQGIKEGDYVEVTLLDGKKQQGRVTRINYVDEYEDYIHQSLSLAPQGYVALSHIREVKKVVPSPEEERKMCMEYLASTKEGLKYFPALAKDREFILKVVTKYPRVYRELSVAMKADKEIALATLSAASDFEKRDLYRGAVPKNLFEDPEVQKAAGV